MRDAIQTPDAPPAPAAAPAPADPRDAAHAWTIERTLRGTESDGDRGLDEATVERRLAADGFNELTEAPPSPWWRRLSGQFREPVIWILLLAAVVAGAIGEWTDTAV